MRRVLTFNRSFSSAQELHLKRSMMVKEQREKKDEAVKRYLTSVFNEDKKLLDDTLNYMMETCEKAIDSNSFRFYLYSNELPCAESMIKHRNEYCYEDITHLLKIHRDIETKYIANALCEKYGFTLQDTNIWKGQPYVFTDTGDIHICWHQ